MRIALLAAFATMVGVGTAAAAGLSEPFAAAPLPATVAVRLTPLAVLPREDVGSPARNSVTFVLPVHGSTALFATSTTGAIYRTDTAGAAPRVFLDLQNPPAGQGAGFDYLFGYRRFSGLSGVAFHPNFDGDPGQPGYGVLYTANTVAGTRYTALGGAASYAQSVVQEWTTATPEAPRFAGTSRVVLAVPADTASHNLGALGFNPAAAPGSADYGKLYIAMGDGQLPEAGGTYDPQSKATPGGKILRIDPAAAGGKPYTVPADNPFVGQAGALGEVWAYGLRNPQSFSWDRATGTMFINDIGEYSLEEVDIGLAGANYGWPLREGTLASDGTDVFPLPANDASYGFTYPVAEYDHTQGNAIGPGFVYRGSAIPDLVGQYVFSDFPNGLLFYFDPMEAGGGLAPLHSLALADGCFVCLNDPGDGRADLRLGQDDTGELLAVAKATGTVYRVDAVPVPEPASWVLLAALLPLVLAGAARRDGGGRRIGC